MAQRDFPVIVAGRVRQLRPPRPVLDIADRLEREGFEAWCVGGALRDALLGGHPLDWDLATDATPQQVIALFGRRRTVPVGIEFGTVAVVDDAGIAHEITTFRRDVRTDGRHAVVEFGARLDDDLARRDFTINAIAFRPSTGELRDPFGGQRDLHDGVVRAVGDAEQRMREDRLRALRAIRFAARYGFDIDRATVAAIRSSAPHLGRLSAERVQQEITKTLQQVERPSLAFTLWRDAGLFATLVPALSRIDDVALRTLDCLPRPRTASPRDSRRTLDRLTALLLDAEESPGAILRTLRFSNREVEHVARMVELWRALAAPLADELSAGAHALPADGVSAPGAGARPGPGENSPSPAGSPTPAGMARSGASPLSDADVRRLLARLGRLRAGAFMRVAAARWSAARERGRSAPSARAVRVLYRRLRAHRLAPLTSADLAIGGEELRRAGIAPGPIYAKILAALLDLVLDDPARNTPEALASELPRLRAALEREPSH